jgi:hypothetical protein
VIVADRQEFTYPVVLKFDARQQICFALLNLNLWHVVDASVRFS